MKYIDRINASARQTFTINTIDDGQQVSCTLNYLSTQRIWEIDISWQDFNLRGVPLLVSPNIIRQYKNVIPFGFALTSLDGFDPFYLQDFTSRRCRLYLLSRAEIEEIEATLESDAINRAQQLLKTNQFIVTETDLRYIVTEDNKKILAEQEAYV